VGPPNDTPSFGTTFNFQYPSFGITFNLQYPMRRYTSKEVCSQDGCLVRPAGRGLCKAHYAQWYQTHKGEVQRYRPRRTRLPTKQEAVVLVSTPRVVPGTETDRLNAVAMYFNGFSSPWG
jgi:hypothetical protein